MTLEDHIAETVKDAIQAVIGSLDITITHVPDPSTSYTLQDAAARMHLSVYDINKLRTARLLRWRKADHAVRILERDIQTYYAWQELFEPDGELPPCPSDFQPFGPFGPGKVSIPRRKAKNATARKVSI